MNLITNRQDPSLERSKALVQTSRRDNLDHSVLRKHIYDKIKPDLERIEFELQRHLTTSVPLIAVVGNHILKSGGKRLRPLLMILAARLCGYQGNDDASLAVVFEFLHAATLLHDDVVDNAEVRRSKPAANTIWGNPTAVLVGDFLYSKSLMLAVRYNNIRILEVLSETTAQMAEGEVLQLFYSDNLETDEEAYMEVITRKTAALISAACQTGGILGGANPEQEQALRNYGHHLGIAFQLIDDALDYTGTTKELGKPVGNDIREGKATLPLIFAMAHGSPRDRNIIRKVFSAERIHPDDFTTIQEIVYRTGGIRYTKELALNHVDKAKKALSIFEDQPAKKILTDIADYVIIRRI